MIVKYTKEQASFIKGISTVIHDGENSYYNIPFWFKEVGEDTFEKLRPEQLPEKVIDILTNG
jgi:hypothetical protein